jgi:hypothetical protein
VRGQAILRQWQMRLERAEYEVALAERRFKGTYTPQPVRNDLSPLSLKFETGSSTAFDAQPLDLHSVPLMD